MGIITKKCRKCGTSFSGKRCKTCAKVANKEWRLKHKKERADYKKQWADAHDAEITRYRKEYNLSHREENFAYSKKYRSLNQEHCAEYAKRYRKAYYQNHKEKWIVASIKRRKYHRDEINLLLRLRRARVRGNSGTFTLWQWNSIVAHYSPEGKCLRCGEIKPLTIDHVVPVTKGGSSNIDNLQPLCKSCNCSKNNKHIDFRIDWGEFARSLDG